MYSFTQVMQQLNVFQLNYKMHRNNSGNTTFIVYDVNSSFPIIPVLTKICRNKWT